jgi:hypothetical protein
VAIFFADRDAAAFAGGALSFLSFVASGLEAALFFEPDGAKGRGAGLADARALVLLRTLEAVLFLPATR